MEKPEFTKQEELAILEEGLKSQFWQIYAKWLTDASFTMIGVALSEKVERREWSSGHATGLKRALNRPLERLRELKRFVKEQEAEKHTSTTA
jgi:hypothetical protein